MYKKFLVLILPLLLSACFPLTGYGVKDINISDTKETVIEKIGQPYTKKAFYNKEYMGYYVYDDIFSLFLNIKQFPYVGFYPFLRTGVEYWVILEDNKVVAFGSAKNFNNNIPKSLNANGSLEVLNF